ncbi:hypothetical protein ACHWQZ_G016841 [Mnemiopsis leidyi]
MDSSLGVKETNWSLCGGLACDMVVPHLYYEKHELCLRQNACKNLDQEQKKRLNCCKTVNEDAESKSEDCKSLKEQNTTNDDNNRVVAPNNPKICDGLCDDWNCVDESDCNGFFYGQSCKPRKITIYIPVFEICDGRHDCLIHSESNIPQDEKGCSDITPTTSSCISGELYRLESIKKIVPIYNYTRCATIAMAGGVVTAIRYDVNWTNEIKKFGLPYCVDYLDQTNCTDSRRVAVSCEVEGFGYSTVSRAMVCGGISVKKKFCVDGMDVACVDVDRSCTLHKHQLCDGLRDCASGADENHPFCLSLTKQKCFRNFRTGKELRIPVAWLGDGLEDCLNGLDENWDIECGLESTIKRFKVNDDCQDVFICRYGESSFIRLNELCDGMDKCGNENSICEVGRGLTSLSSAVSIRRSVKNLKYCLQGLEDVVKKAGSLCISSDFNPFNENLYGVGQRTRVIYPTEESDCNFVFGEAYVLLSCLGKCRKSDCPLKRPVDYRDCPGKFKNRIYTVADQHRLTFVTRRGNTNHRDYHRVYDSSYLETFWKHVSM